jgi:hypothetical protein
MSQYFYFPHMHGDAFRSTRPNGRSNEQAKIAETQDWTTCPLLMETDRNVVEMIEDKTALLSL